MSDEMSDNAANVLACHFAAQDDTYVHPEHEVAGDAAIAALAAAGLTVVPDAPAPLDGEDADAVAAKYLSPLAAAGLTVVPLPVDNPTPDRCPRCGRRYTPGLPCGWTDDPADEGDGACGWQPGDVTP